MIADNDQSQQFATVMAAMPVAPVPEPEPRDYLRQLDLPFDLDAQLFAIRDLLRRQHRADKELDAEIKAWEHHAKTTTGERSDLAAGEHADRCFLSFYQSAAHSMATIGMLAPLFEAVFHQCFLGIHRAFWPRSTPTNGHPRWSRRAKNRWDCHFGPRDRGWGKNILGGVAEMLDALDLTRRMPPETLPTLSAIIRYRNNMFHNGIEWPLDVREDFSQRIAIENWPTDWFVPATTDDQPWIFCMSDTFVAHCLTTLEGVLAGFGLFVRDESLARSAYDPPPATP